MLIDLPFVDVRSFESRSVIQGRRARHGHDLVPDFQRMESERSRSVENPHSRCVLIVNLHDDYSTQRRPLRLHPDLAMSASVGGDNGRLLVTARITVKDDLNGVDLLRSISSAAAAR